MLTSVRRTPSQARDRRALGYIEGDCVDLPGADVTAWCRVTVIHSGRAGAAFFGGTLRHVLMLPLVTTIGTGGVSS